MHNPLALLTTEILTVLLDHSFTIFVRQSYPRGKDHFDPVIKETFLITPYTNIGKAAQHFQHISLDPRKYIYRVEQPQELEKLRLAASQPSGYKVYVDKLAAPKWSAPPQMGAKISNYIRSHTKWKAREGEIAANLFLHFGELMLHLTNGREEIKVNLSEIERM